MSGRPCERCGNFDVDRMAERMREESPYEVDEDKKERIPALCSEVQMAFGLLSWLCHDCRKSYFKMAKNHHLTQEYGEASLRLEFWKARIGENTDENDVDEGLRLWREVDAIERRVNDHANEWLIVG